MGNVTAVFGGTTVDARSGDGMTEQQKEVVLAMAEYNLNIAEALRRTYRHRNTIEYHCRQMIELYGLDPRDFYDLVMLVEMAKRDKGE